AIRSLPLFVPPRETRVSRQARILANRLAFPSRDVSVSTFIHSVKMAGDRPYRFHDVTILSKKSLTSIRGVTIHKLICSTSSTTAYAFGVQRHLRIARPFRSDERRINSPSTPRPR